MYSSPHNLSVYSERLHTCCEYMQQLWFLQRARFCGSGAIRCEDCPLLSCAWADIGMLRLARPLPHPHPEMLTIQLTA